MKHLFLFLFFALISVCALSQHSSNSYNKLADSLYAQHHFLHAAMYYEKALKNAPDAGSIMIKLARSYGKLNEINKSAHWYSAAKANRASFSNDDIYQYAQVLSMEEQRGEAEAVLQALIEKDPYARKEREFLEDLLNYKSTIKIPPTTGSEVFRSIPRYLNLPRPIIKMELSIHPPRLKMLLSQNTIGIIVTSSI